MSEKAVKGVLLVNLGTPDSFKPQDIKKYLGEFLSDPRVIDIPDIARFFLVNFIILPTRPKKVSRLYEMIWLKDGSPLLVYGKQVKEELQKELGDSYQVELAMRYGNPSLESILEKFKLLSLESILVIPLFPQYASATTGSVIEEVMNITKKWQIIPSLKFKSYFYDNESYINTWAEIGKKYLNESYDHILFSFHGLPERQIKAGDCNDYCNFGNCCETVTSKNAYCYRAQCIQTAYSISEKLGLKRSDFTVCFQSRLGKDPWIKPYTEETIRDLAKKGAKKILAFSPAFVADCLETISEIGIEYNHIFKQLGGENIQLVESLNSNPMWINTLKEIIINS